MALPAPVPLSALLAPPSDEAMVVDPEINRRKRPREELDVDDDAQPTSEPPATKAQEPQPSRHQSQQQTVDLRLDKAATTAQKSQEVHVEDDTGHVCVCVCACVRACKDRIRWRSTIEKLGSCEVFAMSKGEVRRWPFQDGNPSEALCALTAFCIMALRLICVCALSKLWHRFSCAVEWEAK